MDGHPPIRNQFVRPTYLAARWQRALTRETCVRLLAVAWAGALGTLLGVADLPRGWAEESHATPATTSADLEGAGRDASAVAAKDGESRADESTTEATGLTRRQSLMASLTIFVLAIFVGFEVITKVPPTLHTPLMSGSNAISGITIVGAMLVAGSAAGISSWLGWAAVVFAAINVVGGFLVTHRMLAMFRRK